MLKHITSSGKREDLPINVESNYTFHLTIGYMMCFEHCFSGGYGPSYDATWTMMCVTLVCL